MKVAFAATVLRNQDAWRALDRIVHTFEDGWHVWEVGDPDAVEQSGWLPLNRRSIRELFEKAALGNAWQPRARGPHRRSVVVDQDDFPRALGPEKAARYLAAPLVVFMENRRSDGTFLDAVLGVLADRETVELKERKALVFDSPGGNGELKMILEEKHAEAAKAGIPLRAVVFTDSDGLFANHISDNAAGVRDTCARLGIPCLVLKKRAIENYIPDDVLNAWVADPSPFKVLRTPVFSGVCEWIIKPKIGARPLRSNKTLWFRGVVTLKGMVADPQQTNTRPRLEALLRLDPLQRDHFPLKTGFKGNPWSTNEANLYASTSNTPPPVAAADVAILQSGFGKEIIYVLSVEDASGTRTLHPSLTATGLRARDGAGDLDGLVDLIESEL